MSFNKLCNELQAFLEEKKEYQSSLEKAKTGTDSNLIKRFESEINEINEFIDEIRDEIRSEHASELEDLSNKSKEELGLLDESDSEDSTFDSDFDIEQRIRDACSNHEFVGIICDDAHEHTVKAFNTVCGTPFDDFDDELDNQVHYCKKISKGFDIEILTASTKEEAVDVGILEEETYFVK